MKKNYQILIGLFLLILGGIAGYMIGFNYEHGILVNTLNIIHPIRDYSSSYKFINPLLAYIIPPADQDRKLVYLKNKITDLINKEKNNGLSNGSVFFYDLNRGRWIGINESEKYNPASMLKVVIMTSYLKYAESKPGVLNKSLIYTQDINDFLKNIPYNSPSNLEVGKSYKTSDLIDKMIIDSDNGAEGILLRNIDESSLDAIYTALDIENPSVTLNYETDF